MKIKNVEIGGYIQSKKDSKQLIAGHCYQVAEKDVSDKTVRLFSVDDSFDDSLWFCVSDFRKPRPQLKQLDQSVFNNMHERWKFAAVDEDGSAHRFSKEVFPYRGGFCYEGSDYHEFKFSLIGTGYDTSDWQNSLIERDIAKELLEVDLSSELTGSDLARAMLERGDRFVMCMVANNEANMFLATRPVVVHGCTDSDFISISGCYSFAVAVNNQGEPLTAAEAGF